MAPPTWHLRSQKSPVASRLSTTSFFSIFWEAGLSRPHAPKSLSQAGKRRWRARVDQFAKVSKLNATVLDAVSSWAAAWDALQDATVAWEAAGRPETALGSMGQLSTHPALVRVERARTLEARLNASLERAVRRVPEVEVPEGGMIVNAGLGPPRLLLDGRLHTRSAISGEWVLSRDEVFWEDGHGIRVVDPNSGIPTFYPPPPLRYTGELGDRTYETPEDWQLEWYAEEKALPLEAVLEWRDRWLAGREAGDRRPPQITLAHPLGSQGSNGAA